MEIFMEIVSNVNSATIAMDSSFLVVRNLLLIVIIFVGYHCYYLLQLASISTISVISIVTQILRLPFLRKGFQKELLDWEV